MSGRREMRRGNAAASAGAATTAPLDARTIVVVGAGIGGLVVAGRLAMEGHSVTLLEQNEQVGGRCQSVQLGLGDAWRFDTGPSLLLFKHVYESAFASLGARMEDWVNAVRVEPAAYRVWFAGGSADGSSSSSSSSSTSSSGGSSSPVNASSSRGSHLDLLYDVQAMMAQLEAVEPGAGRAYLSWLSDARTALEVGTANFIARDFEGWPDFLDLRRLLPLLGQVDIAELLGQHDARLARRFEDRRIRALLSFQDLYVGLSPYSAPGVFSLLAATEITDGVWYPVGGFGKVRDALAQLAASHGVTIRTGARVQRVLCPGGAVSGVELEGGEVIAAHTVVMNGDVPTAYEAVQHSSAPPSARQLASWEYSAGVIAFNWALDTRLDALLHHNVFMSDEWERSWQRASSPDGLCAAPNFYVHCPARSDPSAAPAGGDSVMVLLPVANMQERGGDDDYSALIKAGRAAVLETLAAAGVGDVAPHIVHEHVIDPRMWRDRYGLKHGAAFGLSHGLTQLALLRPGPKDPSVRGLYFVGASARPGNGVPLVMMGAELCAKRMLNNL